LLSFRLYFSSITRATPYFDLWSRSSAQICHPVCQPGILVLKFGVESLTVAYWAQPSGDQHVALFMFATACVNLIDCLSSDYWPIRIVCSGVKTTVSERSHARFLAVWKLHELIWNGCLCHIIAATSEAVFQHIYLSCS